MVDLVKMKDFLNTGPGFNRYNGLKFTVVEEGYCECVVELDENGKNPQGVAHGSLLFALCDAVTGVATATTDHGMLTQSASVHYLRPASGGRLTAKSKLLHSGKTTALCLAEVYDEQEHLLVTGEFEVFYTSDRLVLPEKQADGTWKIENS